MKELRDSLDTEHRTIKIGGLIGCKNDCYQPNEGLSTSESERFHSWQLDRLAKAGVDFLTAATLPNVEEAVGIAEAMEKTDLPYLLSFVIDRSGRVLDGTDLIDAVATVDDVVERPPLGYMVNCAYPTFLCADQQPRELYQRLVGYQANASSLDHEELEGASELQKGDVSKWGEAMLELNRKYGVTILGGCCGTGVEHLRYLVGA
jgi:S-methylmethionine-dependent homocysteine/selenocysteine methylase